MTNIHSDNIADRIASPSLSNPDEVSEENYPNGGDNNNNFDL